MQGSYFVGLGSIVNSPNQLLILSCGNWQIQPIFLALFSGHKLVFSTKPKTTHWVLNPCLIKLNTLYVWSNQNRISMPNNSFLTFVPSSYISYKFFESIRVARLVSANIEKWYSFWFTNHMLNLPNISYYKTMNV